MGALTKEKKTTPEAETASAVEIPPTAQTQLVGELVDSARARAGFYRTIASLYLSELDAAGIERLANAIDPGTSLGDATMEEGWRDIAAYLRHRDSATRLDLAVDFAGAILAAGSYEERKATPYESVFTSESGLLMQEARDDVYRLMCEQHLGVREDLRTPEDHLSFECEFMAKLADRQAQALEEGRADEALAALKAQREMHANHLLNWIDAYCDCLDEAAKTRFYRGVSKLTRGFVHLDEAYIADSLAAVEELAAS